MPGAILNRSWGRPSEDYDLAYCLLGVYLELICLSCTAMEHAPWYSFNKRRVDDSKVGNASA
jgi:hypothetical protein